MPTKTMSASLYGLSQLYKLDLVYSIRVGNNTGRYVALCDISVVLIPPLVSTIITVVKIDKYIKYFDCLRQCDSLLKKVPTRSKKYLFVTVVTMGFTATIVVFDMVMWITISSRDENIYTLFGYFLPYYVCYLFTMVVELLYWQSVYSIKVRLICLNQKLEDAVVKEDSLSAPTDRKRINNLVDTLKEEKSKNDRKNKPAISPEEVRNLITSYQKLIDATNAVNDYLGLVILIVILGCLMHLLVTPYSLYALIFNTGNSMFIVSQSIWMIGHILRLLLIVEPCHGCLTEANKTTSLVCKLLCTELEKVVKKSLEFFLSYLSECRIQFTAFGLTKINRGLLTTIAGAVTTYLVILFQFQ